MQTSCQMRTPESAVEQPSASTASESNQSNEHTEMEMETDELSELIGPQTSSGSKEIASDNYFQDHLILW